MKKAFVSGLLAGCAIGLGGTVYLSVDDRVLGAALFTVGLFVICTMGLSLYTGRICYAPWEDRAYRLALPAVWLGNLAGAAAVAAAVGLTRLAPALAPRAQALCQTKLDDGPVSMVILSVLCGMMVYIAVEGYRTCPYEAGRYLSLFFGVTVFILSGFEHCIANAYYFTLADVWSGEGVVCLLLMTLGNSLGGMLLPALRRCIGA